MPVGMWFHRGGRGQDHRRCSSSSSRRGDMVPLPDGFPDSEGDGLAMDPDAPILGSEPPGFEGLQQGVHETERPRDRGPGHRDVQQGDPAGLVPRGERVDESILVQRRPVQRCAGGAHAGVKARDPLGDADVMLGLLLTRHVG